MKGINNIGVTAIAIYASLKAEPPKYPRPNPVKPKIAQTRIKKNTFPAFSSFRPTIQ